MKRPKKFKTIKKMLEGCDKIPAKESSNLKDLCKSLYGILKKRKKRKKPEMIEMVFPSRKAAEDFRRWMADEREFFKDMRFKTQ